MNGVLDVYEKYFANLNEPVVQHLKKNLHTCLICREEYVRDGSYGKTDKLRTENITLEYLEHLNVFGYGNHLTKIFIKSVRDSGILCKKVKGFWEFKEHETEPVFVFEHSVNF